MDRASFVEAATKEWQAVYRFALRLTRDADRAQDLVQDVYARALRADRIEAFDPRGGGVRAFLFRIAYRLFLTAAERERGERELFQPLEVAGEPAARPAEAVDARTARDFDWEGVDERLRRAVDRLDPGSREVLLLWAVERLKYREIADVLDLPIGTVMSRLHRARTLVSAELLADRHAAQELGLPPAEPRGTRPRGVEPLGGPPREDEPRGAPRPREVRRP
jgi:RNA polymerase sigma-70 factor (ECF subfamily)